MGVPNNFSYTLRNVVDEIPGVQTSLKDCFDDADDESFDPAYGGSSYSGEGTGFDRLRNFRNYGEHIDSRSVTIRPYFFYTDKKSLYGEGAAEVGWGDIRNCTVNWNFETEPAPLIVSVKRTYTGYITIGRAYLAFDLRGLTGLAQSVKLHIKRNTSVGVGHGFNIYRANWGDPLATTDACSSVADLLSGANSGYTQDDSSYVYTIESVSGDLSSFDTNAMDSLLSTVLVHSYDHDDTLPDLGDDFAYMFYKGVEISQSLVWNAELRINYEGNPFLNAYAPLNGNWENIIVPANATVEIVFISANDLNDWDAVIDDSPAWIAILNPNTGSGSYKIDVSIGENNTTNERSATIRIGSDAVGDSLIYVHQVGTPSLTATPDPYDAAYNDANQVIHVMTYPDTNAWTALFVDTGDGTGWIHFVGGNTGIGGGIFTINCDDNDGNARSCDIKIENNDAADYVVDVDQDAGGISGGSLDIDNFKNQVDSLNIDVTPYSMDTTSIKINTGDGTGWFNITSTPAQNGDFNLTIELAGTPAVVNKSAQIKIEDDDSTIEEVIAVNYTYIP